MYISEFLCFVSTLYLLLLLFAFQIKVVQGHKDGFKLKLRSPGYKAKADVIIDVIDYGHKTNKETQTYSILYFKNKPKS